MRGVPNVLEESGEDGVDRSRRDDRRCSWSVCEGDWLDSWRVYDNRSRGRACVGSFTVSGEVLYREIRNRGKGPPLAVADEGVVEHVLPVVKCVEIGARLLVAGEEKIFCFSSSEVCRIV